MPDFIQYFLFLGFAGLMFLLRLDARRFGAAEWDTEQGSWRVWAPRISWYVAGLALSLLIFGLHPSPVSELNLTFAPDRGLVAGPPVPPHADTGMRHVADDTHLRGAAAGVVAEEIAVGGDGVRRP